MREIKFRAWHKPTKKMFEVRKLSRSMVSGKGDNTLYTCKRDEVLLMQNTGLKDMNGKEIYEGDILLYRCNIFGDIFSKVVFNKGCYMVLEPGFALKIMLSEISEDSVVAGNVFDSPELLKGE
ncbi:MAG TPA: YopX family protein [Clostridia bacterium]|nr:YopX family protein [Clostridia bacterium]